MAMALLVAFISVSCKKTDKEKERDHLTYTIDGLGLGKGTDWVIILPGLGCKGCIQEAEDFMGKHVKNRKLLFVLTNTESLKILQKKIGIQIKEHPNILVDRKNEFNVPTDNSIYPCIVELTGGEVRAHEFQSPKNGRAFEKLKSRIVMEQ